MRMPNVVALVEAIIRSQGATPDEVPAIVKRLAPDPVPDTADEVLDQVRAAILAHRAETRGET